jgi:hypothetical protein
VSTPWRAGEPDRRPQEDLARRFGIKASPPSPELKAGVAENVRSGLLPLNAMRCAPDTGTSGWFIWAGEVFSQDRDFFVPLHVAHLTAWRPEIVPYLVLPPGWRVLLAPGYEDVWFDEHLLQRH